MSHQDMVADRVDDRPAHLSATRGAFISPSTIGKTKCVAAPRSSVITCRPPTNVVSDSGINGEPPRNKTSPSSRIVRTTGQSGSRGIAFRRSRVSLQNRPRHLNGLGDFALHLLRRTSHDVLPAPLVFEADIFQQLRVGDVPCTEWDRERSAENVRVVDGLLDFQLPERRPADPFGDPQRLAVG